MQDLWVRGHVMYTINFKSLSQKLIAIYASALSPNSCLPWVLAIFRFSSLRMKYGTSYPSRFPTSPVYSPVCRHSNVLDKHNLTTSPFCLKHLIYFPSLLEQRPKSLTWPKAPCGPVVFLPLWGVCLATGRAFPGLFSTLLRNQGDTLGCLLVHAS